VGNFCDKTNMRMNVRHKKMQRPRLRVVNALYVRSWCMHACSPDVPFVRCHYVFAPSVATTTVPLLVPHTIRQGARACMHGMELRVA
jgi:hypothetical protein